MNLSRLLSVTITIFFVICLPRVSNAADLTLQWDPPSDGMATGYILYYGTESHSYSHQVDVGNTSLYTVNGLSNGTTYYFAVRAYDATGATSDASTEVFAATGPDAPPVVSALVLTADVAPPQLLGTTVNWVATAAGGVAPYQFQWTFSGGDQPTVSPWTTASTWTWKPSAAADYQVNVAVRSSGSVSTVGEMAQSVPFRVTAPQVAVTLDSSVAAPQTVGKTIRWSATASGGATYQYRWWVFNGSTWIATTGWKSSSTWSWKPTVPNNGYVVRVWVRRTMNPTDAPEASASVPFPITSRAR